LESFIKYSRVIYIVIYVGQLKRQLYVNTYMLCCEHVLAPIFGALSIAADCSVLLGYVKSSSNSCTGPKGFGRFRLPNFKTIGTWRWYRCLPHAPAAFTPKKIFLVLISIGGRVDPLLLGYVETTSYLEHQARNGVRGIFTFAYLSCLECFWEWGKSVSFGRPTVSSNWPTEPVLDDTWGRTTGGIMKKPVMSKCHVLHNVIHTGYFQSQPGDSAARSRRLTDLDLCRTVNLSTFSEGPCTWSLFGLPPVSAMNFSNSCRVSLAGCLCLMSTNVLDSLNILAICTVWRRSP